MNNELYRMWKEVTTDLATLQLKNLRKIMKTLVKIVIVPSKI
jgi:hypothetical protein